MHSTLADPSPRCKHLCCREGVDRKPKPPKNASLPTPLTDDRLASASGRSKPSYAAEEQQSRLSTIADVNGNIETLDLTTPKKSMNHVLGAARGLRNIERLHQSVTKGIVTPVAIQMPPFDYSKGERPCFSFFTQDKGRIQSDTPSELHSDESANDLPSNADFTNSKGHSSHLEHEGTLDELKDQPLDLPRPKAFDHGSQNPYNDLEASVLEANTDFPSHGDISDTEDALIGLNDSMDLQQSVQFLGTESLDEKEDNRRGQRPQSDKLFLSTDTPEKHSLLQEKRTAGEFESECSSSPAANLKRRRIAETNDRASSPLGTLKQLNAGSIPKIKTGQPAWVYSFDPAFIAEYQDFVDFI